MVSPGEYLVVKLEAGLHQSRVNGIMLGIREKFPGVENVTDMTRITRATLDCILREPTPLLRSTDRSAYNAIRDYHRRKRQPKLEL